MMEYLFTKEESWLNKWDKFVVNNSRGNHLVLSDWLKSYISYGFDYEIGLVLKDQKIVGGCGVVIPRFLFFKFYIVPHGPIFNEGFEHNLQRFLNKLKNRAKLINCCYMQISVPFSSNNVVHNRTYSNDFKKFIANEFKEGKLFNYIYSSYGLNWLNLRDYKDAQSLLEQLTPKVRRNIRMPYNKSAKAYFVTDIESIEKGYHVIQENAKQAGYAVRSFTEFKNTIDQLIKKKHAYFVICKINGAIKAAAFFIETSGYITNIMGGVIREKPDIKLGYMLQWEIIKKSFENGFLGYNISMGGSPGVQDFKSKFKAKPVYYENPNYYLILKPFNFKIFKFLNTFLKSNKTVFSKILSHFKK